MIPVFLLAACQGVRTPAPPEAPPPSLPPPADTRMYRVVPQQSLVHILVYRAGAFAAAGHNHVIACRDLTGRIHLHEQPARSAFELHLPVRTLTVDEASLRRREGADFAAGVPQAARAGTRENMLGSAVLDEARHPVIRIVSGAIDGAGEDLEVALRVGLRGRWHDLSAPVRVRREGGRLIAAGQFVVRHGQLGLEPFSALLGALKVQDEMTVKFSIVAVAR